jgi:hypothetical protein
LQGYKNILFSFQLAGLVVFNKDPTVWLDGARIPQKYICKYKKIILSPNGISLIMILQKVYLAVEIAQSKVY